MSNSAIVNRASKAFYRVGFKLKKHSPEILAVAGTVGVIASGVMACRATTKLSAIMEEHKEQVEQVHDYVDEKGFSKEYSEDDNKKDLAIIYTQTGFKTVKLYAPAVTLGALSLAALLGSNHILRKRNIALGAAYAALDKGFKNYRSAVVERFGEELDKELKYNLKTKKIEEVVVDENGKEKKVKKDAYIVDPDKLDPTDRLFYAGNPGWDKDPYYTKLFLFKTQAFLNDKLQTQGYLFLNDVYEALGFSKTREGQVLGWVYDEKNPIGDNNIDFGLDDFDSDAKIRFINGDEECVLLSFNHDGNILKYM